MSAVERPQPSLTPAWLDRGPVPTEPYRASTYFELERDRIFRRVWLCVGREEEVPGPGHFIVRELEVCGASALIVRGTDGVVRAFHNVCSHRSNKVAWESSGHAKQFVCRYHSWSYGLDGALRGVPDATMFFELDKRACGLAPIHVAVWEGFLFVNLDPSPTLTLEAFLGGMGDKLRGYPFGKFSSYAVISCELRANWKVAIDAFQEGYHVGALHRRTIGPQFTSHINPCGRLISAEFFGPHRSGSIWGNREFAPRPSEMLAFSLNARIGGDAIGTGPSALEMPGGINPTADPNWAVEMNVLFPNLFIFASRQGFITHRFWPTSVNTTRWEARVHFAPPRTASQLFSQQFSVCAVRDTFIEDAVNLERSQQGIDSGAKSVFHFQDNEVFLRHQYAVVEAYVHGRQLADWTTMTRP